MADAPRIAVICLGYLGNPAGVARLAGYFRAAAAELFVHIDSRVAAASYADALGGMPCATLLDDRQAIHWGGFSIVAAVLDILTRLFATGQHDRFCLITEDSVPLVPPATFAALMAQPVEFIQADPQVANPVTARYDGYYWLDHPATNPRSPMEARVVDPALGDALRRLEALRRRGKAAVSLHHGANWWALSRAAVGLILQRHASDPHLAESFEFSLIPEEQYFHTILAEAGSRRRQPFMYADFTGDPAPKVYFTAAEIVRLRAMPFVFARKAHLASADIDGYMRDLALEH